MLCYFASLLLMDNHSSSLLVAMYLFPHVQKIPTDGEAQLCPGSHWGGNLTLSQEQLSRATCCCHQAVFNFFLGFLLQRPLSGGEEPMHAVGVWALSWCLFIFPLCCASLAASINTLKCLLSMLRSSCPYMTEGISHTSMKRTQRWNRKVIIMY